MLDAIRKRCAQVAIPLGHVVKAGAEAVHCFNFDIGSLKNFTGRHIRLDSAYTVVFEQLAAVKRPVVYVFEITSPTNPAEVLRAAQSRSLAGSLRAISAFRNKIDANSSILYVGKVKSNFQARVIRHLGFWKTAATQGLQMYHWTRELDLQVNLTAFEFKSEMADLLPLLQKTVASELNPLLGKHQ